MILPSMILLLLRVPLRTCAFCRPVRLGPLSAVKISDFNVSTLQRFNAWPQ
jgi:hypothetical protein